MQAYWRIQTKLVHGYLGNLYQKGMEALRKRDKKKAKEKAKAKKKNNKGTAGSAPAAGAPS